MCTWFVRKVSVPIFLCTHWQRSKWIGWASRALLLFVYGLFSNLVTFAMQENIEQWYAIKFCVKLNKSATETFASLTEAYGDAPLSKTWFLSGTKLSKRAEKMLKTTLVLEDQFRQQMIKMWKWCRLRWRKTPIECQDDCRRNGLE